MMCVSDRGRCFLAMEPLTVAARLSTTPGPVNPCTAGPLPMKRAFTLLALVAVFFGPVGSATLWGAEPLRVFLRGGRKTHGPNAHEHERFLNEWKRLLTERGMQVEGAMDWPDAAQLQRADVLVMYAQDGGNATEAQKAALDAHLKRGGGLVVIHTASVSNDPPWWKSVIGGAWVPGKTRWKEGPMDLYYTENQWLEGGHPITRGASNFHLNDEIYYDMDLAPGIRVLATSYTPRVRDGKKEAEGGKAHIYDIQPQMWVYERKVEGGTEPYRAFVSIPGHLYGTFEKPHFRALLLRGIAWAGKRDGALDGFARPEELAALTYPEGGPQRPEQTRGNLEVHPDFDLKLVAAEPLLSKPINFDWDAAGRLWVAETPEYPNGRRGMRPDYRGREWKDHGGVDPRPGQQERPARDKVTVLTDRNGDGVMDHREVFHEGLDLVTGLVFYKDGVIVTQAPEILWLRDTNRDGRCDRVEKLYTGLGTRDTHAVINNPRMGWDGWVYATHGYSGSQHVLSGDGQRDFGVIGSGVVRFRPDGTAFEQYSSKGGNTWGLTVTGENRVFWTQPTSGVLLMHTVLPEAALGRGKVGTQTSFKQVIRSPKSYPAMGWEQMAYVQIDFVGSFTAAAGCVIYDGGTWPAEYAGDYFTTEPTINIVHHQRLQPEGASYTAAKLPGREETEFIRSRDMWWRPIEVRVGPDGAMYIADFYNQAVIHNDTRGPDHNEVNAAVRPDRDHYFGRVWRINHKAARTVPVPDLSRAGDAELAAALEHPNRAVRLMSVQLLAERPSAASHVVPRLQKGDPLARVAALWALQRMGKLSTDALQSALADASPEVRRNAALVVEERPASNPQPAGLRALLRDRDPQVRVAGLRALAVAGLDEAGARELVAAWPGLDDDFQRSAAVGAAMSSPESCIGAALTASNPDALRPLVGQLAAGIGERKLVAAAAALVRTVAAAPGGGGPLGAAVLEELGRGLKQVPELDAVLTSSLKTLLGGPNGASALPLAAAWDRGGKLSAEIGAGAAGLVRTLQNSSAAGPVRVAAARNLLGLGRGEDLEKVLAVALGAGKLQGELVTLLGETGASPVGKLVAEVYGNLTAEGQGAAFAVLLQRGPWALAFLDAIQAGRVDAALIGPVNVGRLRTHPDKGVASRANAMLDKLLGPAARAKNDLIARLAPEVEKPGDAARGKQIFASACAVCHKLGDAGAEVGPALTGMGAHGPAELLVHIIDPNREVDPSFVTWNLETKDGQFHSGIIVRENPGAVTLKGPAGLDEVKTAAIKTKVNTGRSLMPEGFEGLGAEALRDLLTHLCGGEASRFRLLDLRSAFTADSRNGLYQSLDRKGDTLPFRKFGTQQVDGVPFAVVDPAKVAGGNNLMVLRGGPRGSHSSTLPEKVEVRVGGFRANRLHFLGGVTGWGYQGGDPSDLMAVTVEYTGGGRERLVFRNGVEFSDYYRRFDVPGSRHVDGMLESHQVRWFTKPLAQGGPVERLVLESVNPRAAATLAAITAEWSDAKAPAPAPAKAQAGAASAASASTAAEDAGFVPQFTDPVPEPPAQARGPRVLLVGGGSSHDFAKWFGGTDKATLGGTQTGWVDYTQNANGVHSILGRVEVLGWSANQPVSSRTRKALMDFAGSGKGLVLMHPGTWYAWKNFPEWNRQLVGGGARGHDRLGEFEVEVVQPGHPLMEGLPKTFRITDELYQFKPDPDGAKITVLAQAKSPVTGEVFPQVWLVEHPKSRIACITLGHDGRAHDLPEYQRLVRNLFQWAGAKH